MKKYENLLIFYKLTNLLLAGNISFKRKLQKSLEIILNYIESQIGSIMILKDNKYLEVVASTNKKILNIKVDIEKNNCPAIEAFKSKKVIKGEIPLNNKNRYNCKHYVIFPIKVRREVYGVLNITKKKNDAPYTDKEIKIIEKFINSIAILIKNVILEENLKKEKENLEKLNKELIETQKLKEELIHLIIHDLKSPLSQIISNLDLLYQSKNLSKEDFEVIDSAILGCEDLNRMILNILDIYKMENNSLLINKTKEEIHTLLDEVIDKFEGLLEIKEQKLIKKYDKKLCYVSVDKNLMIRVLNNLIHNAIKYSPVNEKIIISTKCNDEQIKISIKNTGIGIDKDKLKNIWNKFYSTYRKHESSGLGLTFCKMAVESMGGKIKATSKPDKWTKFTLIFPKSDEIKINEDIFKIEL